MPIGPASLPAQTAVPATPSPLRTALPQPNNSQQNTMFRGVRTTPRNTRQTISNNEMEIDSEDDVGRPATRVVPTVVSALDNSTPSKRKRDGTRNEDMDGLDLESSEERELMQLADQAEGNLPQHQAHQRGLPASPAPAPVTPTRSTPQQGPSTPTSARTARSVSSAFRNRLMIAAENPPPQKKARANNTDKTPTRAGPFTVPQAFLGRDAIGTATQTSPSQNDVPNVAGDIMRTLEQNSVPAQVCAAVRNQLEGFSLRYKGVIAGRDMAREAVKTRNAKIQELEARLAELEKANREPHDAESERARVDAEQERARIAGEAAHLTRVRATVQEQSVRIAELQRALVAERERARVAEKERDQLAEKVGARIVQQETDARDDEDDLESRLESLDKTSQGSDSI